MTSLDISNGVRTALTRLRGAWEWYDALPVVRRIHSALGQVAEGWRRASRWLNSVMPKGLYARALLIIAPMVILQSVIAFVFMERHWSVVTQRLSASVVQDIAALIDIYRGYPQDADQAQIRRIAQQRLGLVVDFLPLSEMPPPGPKPFFSLLDQALAELRKQIGRPYWMDTVGKSALLKSASTRQHRDAGLCGAVRLYLQLEIFLLWMVGTSTVLLTVAIIFLRNQIKPILRLADAAESFGKGREVPNFRPRGAREVRRAAAGRIRPTPPLSVSPDQVS
jgi:two-component system osmolarity sensor histidine kinase EnvZ